ncbi:hypothetical protein PF004_g23062 [Phytophthora fragariae]|uniref:Uncharacterized protein n=1 Tax=Phytophthora fragariae TaxID=53985 RepID=A0A6A3IIV1_9STRA|nr:hypothetical protein PF011_g21820 [Phytophthora fragariae]KAE9186505.1 hypothetical protein PF004_g23062 [Phytophthora fragariae]
MSPTPLSLRMSATRLRLVLLRPLRLRRALLTLLQPATLLRLQMLLSRVLALMLVARYPDESLFESALELEEFFRAQSPSPPPSPDALVLPS